MPDPQYRVEKADVARTYAVVDDSEQTYQVGFYGPRAEELAEEYARFKNEQGDHDV